MNLTASHPTASIPGDPRFPFPPDAPFPPERPFRPGEPFPHRPTYPPVPLVPMPGPDARDDLRSRMYDQLLERRTVVLDRALDGETATLVAAQLMTLDAEGTEPITLVVNSPGGPVDAATAVLDTVDFVRAPVDTTCLGQAVGTAVVVLAAGTGRRRIGPSAQVRLRLADIAMSGSASRLGDDLRRLDELQRGLIDRLAAATGQDRRLIERDVEQGRALSGPEAVAYGLVDEVIERPRS